MRAPRKRIYEIVEVAAPGDRVSRAFDISILAVILLNIVALVLETVRPLYDRAPSLFKNIEVVSIIVFTVEYLARIWSCTASAKYAAPLRGRLRFASKPMVLIDLLAILPFYLPFLGLDLRFMRAVRLFRFFRIAKLGRYSTALQTLGSVLHSRKEELFSTLLILLLLLLVASSLMYFAENTGQPESFSSIPAAMWWAVATLTTVGYGDVLPVTPLGKLLASFIAILGIGMFALPTGILGAAFVEEIQKVKDGVRICPHCGKHLETGGKRLDDAS